MDQTLVDLLPWVIVFIKKTTMTRTTNKPRACNMATHFNQAIAQDVNTTVHPDNTSSNEILTPPEVRAPLRFYHVPRELLWATRALASQPGAWFYSPNFTGAEDQPWSLQTQPQS
jgi:hypothetical protein